MSRKLDHLQAISINIINIDSTTNLTQEHSGSIIFCDATNAFTLYLPPPKRGLNLTLILKTSSNTNDITIISKNSAFEDTDLMYLTNSGLTHENLYGTILLKNSQAKIGDRINFVCDGTNWFGSCVLNANNAVTDS